MDFSDVARLLDPTPMALETGYERLTGGVLHVAARTDLRGCSGAMFDWWFGWRPLTREYRWWHPLDHISSTWVEGEAGSATGSIHQVVERFTGGEAEALSIQFIDPHEVFDAAALAAARDRGDVAAVICARGGAGHVPHRAPDGAIVGTRLIHLCRNNPTGTALRTHFFLGQDLPSVGMPAEAVAELFPDSLAPRLLQHCYDEFTTLARLLPSLYEAETGAFMRPW